MGLGHLTYPFEARQDYFDDVTPELQDAALLATEMLRLNLLTSSEYWPTYHRPTEEGVCKSFVA